MDKIQDLQNAMPVKIKDSAPVICEINYLLANTLLPAI
jgi:hypothetical protein